MIKLKRVPRSLTSHYATPDGAWEVWREPYAPCRWFVNQRDADATEVGDGFASKREAVAYLEHRLRLEQRIRDTAGPRLFLVTLRTDAVRHGPYPVAADHPRQAATFFVDRLIDVGSLAASTWPRPVYVCEYVWDGTLGFKVAANREGDIRYDVIWDGLNRTVELSERSYASED